MKSDLSRELSNRKHEMGRKTLIIPNHGYFGLIRNIWQNDSCCSSDQWWSVRYILNIISRFV